MANYSGHNHITVNENENLVYIREVVAYMHEKYGDNIKIRYISFIMQYATGFRHDKVMFWQGKLSPSVNFFRR